MAELGRLPERSLYKVVYSPRRPDLFQDACTVDGVHDESVVGVVSDVRDFPGVKHEDLSCARWNVLGHGPCQCKEAIHIGLCIYRVFSLGSQRMESGGHAIPGL